MYDRYMRATVSIREYDDDGNIVEPTTSRAEDRYRIEYWRAQSRAANAALADREAWMRAMWASPGADPAVQHAQRELVDARGDGPYADPAGVVAAERAHRAACLAVAHRLGNARRQLLAHIRACAEADEATMVTDVTYAADLARLARDRERMRTGLPHVALISARTTTQRAAVV